MSLPASKWFDLTKPSHDLFLHEPLRDDTVMQSFTFDYANHCIFVAQVMKAKDADYNGDLCITKLDFHGNKREHMYLKGFGHGVSIGCQPANDTWLWTEVGPVTHVKIDPNKGSEKENLSARGSMLARFKFTNGATIHRDDVNQTYQFVRGDNFTCATDTPHMRLAVRYRNPNGTFRYAVFSYADIEDHGEDASPLVDIPQPTELNGRVFQGYTIYGQYLYMLEGQSKEKASEGNSFVSSVNLNTGGFRREATRAGWDRLKFREPEGMAVYVTDGGEPRLFLGFASGDPGDRRANLFYKNDLV